MADEKLPPDRGPPTNVLVDLSQDDPMEDVQENGEDVHIIGDDSQRRQQVTGVSNGDLTDYLPGNRSTPIYSKETAALGAAINPSKVIESGKGNIDNCNNRENNNVISEGNSSVCDANSDKQAKTPGADNGDIRKRQEHFDELARNKYRITDSAPYFVYVEHSEKKLGRLFPIKVGHFLYQQEEFRNSIKDIVPIGINRVKIIAKTYSVANKLVDHPTLLKNGLRSYIPTYFTQKKGVVKLVDTMFDIDYLRENIQSEQEILEVRRMRRKVINRESGREEFIDRQTIVITFLGSTIPSKVRINFCIFPVEPWIYPVVKCFSCLRFGHVSEQCKGKLRCSRCGTDGHNHANCLAETTLCIHCNSSSHHSNSKKCPAYTRQYNIKKIMAIENISFKEAEYIADNPSYAKIATHNRFAILNDEENFPSLPSQEETATSNRLFISKPRVEAAQRVPPQILNQGKRKVRSPSPVTARNTKRHTPFFSQQPPQSHAQQTHQESSHSQGSPTQLTYTRQPNSTLPSTSTQSQTLISKPVNEDYMNFKREIIMHLSLHFESLIKKIIPEEIYSHAETRDNINQFYASLQSFLNISSNDHNASAKGLQKN